MNNNTYFTMDFVSEDKHDHLAIEIYYRNQRLCQITKEKGNDNMMIEFLTDLYLLKENIEMTFPLSIFLNVIDEAKTSLAKCP